MSLRHRPSGRSNPRKCWWNSLVFLKGVYSKDFILALIAKYGVACGVGYVVEYRGQAIDALSMEERMTICNMSIEFGSKMGIMNQIKPPMIISKDRNVFRRDFEEAVADGRPLSVMRMSFTIRLSDGCFRLGSYGDLGNQPCYGVDFDSRFPEIKDMNDERAYNYMDLEPGQKPADIELGYIFIGSCTNARLSDLQLAARFVKGRRLLLT